MAIELICEYADSAASIVLTVMFGMGLDFVKLLREKTFGRLLCLSQFQLLCASLAPLFSLERVMRL